MPKIVYFLEKTVKITAASGALPPNSAHRLSHCYSLHLLSLQYFVNINPFYYPQREQKQTTTNILHLLLPRFCSYLSLQTLQFCCWGAKIFFVPVRRVP